MAKKSNLQKLSSSNKVVHQKDEKYNSKDAIKREINIGEKNQKNNDIILIKGQFFNKYSKYLPWIILILVIIIYSNSINNGFLNWDDDRYVSENRFLVLTWANIKYFFANFYFVMYIPLSMISYMIDYKLVGLSEPWVFHLHNLILHLINTILVFYLIKKLFSKEIVSRNILAFFVAILFGIHPLHVESVSWIAERKDVLYSLYFLVSLLMYLKYINSKKKIFYFLTFIFFVLSLFAKTQAVVLSMVLILIDYYRLNFLEDKNQLKKFFQFKASEQWKLFLEKIPFFILSAIFGYIAIKASGTNEPLSETIAPHRIAVETGYGFFESIMLVSYSLFIYVAELFVPFKQSGIHPYPFEAGTMPWYYVLYFIFSIFYAATMVWAWIKKQKLLLFSLAFFIFNIFIVLKIKNFVISEHYEYLPSIGIFILMVKFLYDYTIKKPASKKIILAFSIIYLSFLGYTSFERNKVFKDSISFWNDVSAKYPEVIVAYYNRANYLQNLGDNIAAENNKLAQEYYQKALIDYEKTIELSNSNVGAYSNMGITYAKIGKYKKAIESFNEVVRIDSTFGNVYSNRGNTNALLGNWEMAINDYTKSLKLKPDFTDAMYNRGLAYLNTDRFDEAISDFSRVLELNANKNEAYVQRGFSFYFSKKYAEAIKDFTYYLNMFPDKYNVIYYRALAYQAIGKDAEAKNDFKTLQKYPAIIDYILQTARNYENIADNNRSITYYQIAIETLNTIFKINQNNSIANSRIGVIFGKQGDMNKALFYLTKAIQEDSTNHEAYSDRGYAYFLTGNFKNALQDYNKAISLNKEDIVTYYNRGILYEKQNLLDKALEDYDKIIGIKSDYGMAYFRRALIFYNQSKKVEACTDFKNAQKYGVTEAQLYIQKYCN